MFNQEDEHIECPWRQRDGMFIAEEEAFVNQQPEATESVPPWQLRVGI
jgi:hypothetical protein